MNRQDDMVDLTDVYYTWRPDARSTTILPNVVSRVHSLSYLVILKHLPQ